MRTVCLGLLVSVWTGAMASGAGYRAGLARVVITPTEPMWLAGYGSRTHATAEKLHDLYAKAMVLEDDHGQRLVFVTTDLIGLTKTITEPVCKVLGQRFHLPREAIVLGSSHTHSGPVLRDSLVAIYNMNPEDWAAVERYTQSLEKKLVTLVGDAIADLKPAKLAHGLGEAGFGVNRRNNKEADAGKPGFKPVGPVDHDVPVLRVTSSDGSLRGILFGYACHATTLASYTWCGDYPGFAMIDIEKAHPGTTAMFVAGCGADINPLPRRTEALCMKYGKELADAVEGVLAREMTAVAGPFAAALRWLDLPFETPLPARPDLEQRRDTGNNFTRRWATRALADLDAGKKLPEAYAGYPVQVFQLGDRLTLVMLAGEVVVDYSLRLKREWGRDRTWVMGYTNDVMGYIPSERVWKEGGYEGCKETMWAYGNPNRWCPQIEQILAQNVHELVIQVCKDETRSKP